MNADLIALLRAESEAFTCILMGHNMNGYLTFNIPESWQQTSIYASYSIACLPPSYKSLSFHIRHKVVSDRRPTLVHAQTYTTIVVHIDVFIQEPKLEIRSLMSAFTIPSTFTLLSA